jgi:hexulose-6-phosphate isomerase
LIDRIGFMQGRLSPMVGGRIQAFPWDAWRDEFALAQQHGFGLMEWTLDQDRLRDNPLMRAEGQDEIRALCGRHGVMVGSLTGDCFMQAPFWKAAGAARDALEADFRGVAEASAAVGAALIVVPLVDNGRIEDPAQEEVVVERFGALAAFLSDRGLRVLFESDFPPAELARFISRLPADVFGINYDIGNSAGEGFDPVEEISRYGARIGNVHVKDRPRGGSTVPLGTGHADFERVFAALGRAGYRGGFILQTARAADGDHAAALCRYREMTADWLRRHAA